MYWNVKQTKKNLHKYFHHSSLKPAYEYIFEYALPRAKKRSAKGSNFKEDYRALPLLYLLLFYGICEQPIVDISRIHILKIKGLFQLSLNYLSFADLCSQQAF